MRPVHGDQGVSSNQNANNQTGENQMAVTGIQGVGLNQNADNQADGNQADGNQVAMITNEDVDANQSSDNQAAVNQVAVVPNQSNDDFTRGKSCIFFGLLRFMLKLLTTKIFALFYSPNNLADTETGGQR